MNEVKPVREAVGGGHDLTQFQAAIDDLLGSGFDRAEISLLASRTAVETKLGHRYRSVRDLEDDPAVPVVAYVSTEDVGDAEGMVTGGILIYVGAVTAAGAILASGRQDILDFEPSVDAAHVGVAVENGIVTLSRNVPTYAQKTTI